MRVFAFFFTLLLIMVSGLQARLECDLGLNWEYDRDYDDSGEVKSRDLARDLGVSWEGILGKGFEAGADLGLYQSQTYNFSGLGLSCSFNSGDFDLQAETDLSKYGYPLSEDYLDRSLYIYAQRDIDRGELGLDLSRSGYDYLGSDDCDYGYTSAGLSLSRERGSKIEHCLSAGWSVQHGKVDFTGDYRNFYAAYDYSDSINDSLFFTGNLEYQKQKEKDPEISDYHEITYGGDLTWSWDRYYLMASESITEHNKTHPQTYDTDYVLYSAYFYGEYTLSNCFTLGFEAGSYSEDHRETETGTSEVQDYVESYSQHDFSFSLNFFKDRISSTLSLDLDELVYPEIAGFETIAGQKTRSASLDISYEATDELDIALMIERENLTYGDGDYTKYRLVELELTWEF